MGRPEADSGDYLLGTLEPCRKPKKLASGGVCEKNAGRLQALLLGYRPETRFRKRQGEAAQLPHNEYVLAPGKEERFGTLRLNLQKDKLERQGGRKK